MRNRCGALSLDDAGRATSALIESPELKAQVYVLRRIRQHLGDMRAVLHHDLDRVKEKALTEHDGAYTAMEAILHRARMIGMGETSLAQLDDERVFGRTAADITVDELMALEPNKPVLVN